MEIDDSTILGWFAATASAIAAAIGFGARVLWSSIKKLWDEEASCQRRLARLEGVMELQAKYERRKELRDAMLGASKGNSVKTSEVAGAVSGGRRGTEK